ncbi:hypothetical protein [Leucobacter luti]|uniref:Alternate signal-mediated exported protein n=1 Tax=Leucobacter luti TaxID=340320 RepID=A0A4Q7TYQ4_9MICO|nr:hypothetical protein [Leucobacter luti]MBL3698756.1 hypothetical protein [Leucobacter luti]RZT66133.1 hypothetical protein EV139_1559 [Leucobacter luti]
MATDKKMKTGRKRAIIAGGALLGIAALSTAAVFTDFANLNLGNGTGGGIGGADNTFNIQVVGTDTQGVPVPGTWQEANVAEGVDIALLGAETITPGDTITVDIPVKNASPKLGADVNLTLGDVPGKTSDADYAAQLRYDIEVDGVAVATAATQAAVADIDLADLAAGAEATVTVNVTLLDQGSPAGNNALQGKTAHVQAQFNAASTN